MFQLQTHGTLESTALSDGDEPILTGAHGPQAVSLTPAKARVVHTQLVVTRVTVRSITGQFTDSTWLTSYLRVLR